MDNQTRYGIRYTSTVHGWVMARELVVSELMIVIVNQLHLLLK